ncbi:DUF1330 domain-containing protein [Clostridium sp. 1001271B_150615_H5]|uniref:DUF1330 domain-containing protein n=1 Tax=Clostridium sp. 1001271B_150615_H5 TaxID=2787105 RepID=UPI001105CB64|nr:DUF1330 domain-containing protein [Clostridium sp. 1001271B_150615_H5]
MSCYFIISVFLEPGKDRTDYDDYIRLVRPIVEEYGGRYVVRSEGIEYMGKDWQPDRFIIIRFPDRESIDLCFSSNAYKNIMSKRENTVDSRAIIVMDGEMYGDEREKGNTEEEKMG